MLSLFFSSSPRYTFVSLTEFVGKNTTKYILYGPHIVSCYKPNWAMNCTEFILFLKKKTVLIWYLLINSQLLQENVRFKSF